MEKLYLTRQTERVAQLLELRLRLLNAFMISFGAFGVASYRTLPEISGISHILTKN